MRWRVENPGNGNDILITEDDEFGLAVATLPHAYSDENEREQLRNAALIAGAPHLLYIAKFVLMAMRRMKPSPSRKLCITVLADAIAKCEAGS